MLVVVEVLVVMMGMVVVMVMMMITKECLVGGGDRGEDELFELMMLMEMLVMIPLNRNLS